METGKKNDALEILNRESENLYYSLQAIAENSLHELAELLVVLALRDILYMNQRNPSEVTVEDYIEATELATAYIHNTHNTTKH